MRSLLCQFDPELREVAVRVAAESEEAELQLTSERAGDKNTPSAVVIAYGKVTSIAALLAHFFDDEWL